MAQGCWSVVTVCATSYSWTTGPHWGAMESPRTAAGTEGPATPTTALCTGPRAFSCLLSYIWTEPDVCTQCVVVDKKADVGASCQQTNSHARSFRLTARPDEHATDAKHVELIGAIQALGRPLLQHGLDLFKQSYNIHHVRPSRGSEGGKPVDLWNKCSSAPRLHLDCTSPASVLHLACISQYLVCISNISTASRLDLAVSASPCI